MKLATASKGMPTPAIPDSVGEPATGRLYIEAYNQIIVEQMPKLYCNFPGLYISCTSCMQYATTGRSRREKTSMAIEGIIKDGDHA